MRYRRLDLNLLVALDAILTERSVTRAAAKLCLSQPAVSGSLARLREYFEDPLIVQVGRQMELTPLAQALGGSIRAIMLQIDNAIATDPAFDPAVNKRHFTIAATDYVIHVLLLDMLRSLSRSSPGVTFEFRQFSPQSALDMQAGEVDLVIGPEIDVRSEHPQVPVFEDTYVVVACRDNPLVKASMTFDEYMGLGHVVFRGERQGLPWLERWFIKNYGDARRIEISVPSFSLLPSLLVGTNRIATLQARLAHDLADRMPLKVLDAPLELPRLIEVLQWNSQREFDPALRWLREQVVAAAATLPAV
jgi:LysR family transcriptional regulator, nod-box dependent transcriptional activator